VPVSAVTPRLFYWSCGPFGNLLRPCIAADEVASPVHEQSTAILARQLHRKEAETRAFLEAFYSGAASPKSTDRPQAVAPQDFND
jgi:hypothetical protein